MKKMAKLFAHVLVLSMLFSATALAKEPVTNMTYEEWLEEQANINPDFEEVDLEPVRVEKNENDMVQAQSLESVESTEDPEMRFYPEELAPGRQKTGDTLISLLQKRQSAIIL